MTAQRQDSGTGWFRIARRFEIESGHRLSGHPEKCAFPHGHTRVVEVVLRSPSLDAHAMVCDYKVLKTLVEAVLEPLDHAMVLSAADPLREHFAPFSKRLVLLEEDPTTEVLARYLFREIRDAFRSGSEVRTSSGAVYAVPAAAQVESVRVWETASTWAEYGEG